MNGDTAAGASGQDGRTHSSPIITNEGTTSPASEKWHCAVSFPTNGVNTFKSNGKCCGVGNPTNPSTGNKFLEETDFEVPGEGGLYFKRFHNSAGWGYATMGLNWSHSWSRKVFIAGTNEAHAERPDGKVYVFMLVGGVWVGDPDVPETLAGSKGVGWTLTTRDDEVETYDGQGYLTSVKTRNGRVTTLAYSDGTASSPFNENSSERHVAPGSLVSVTDFRGRKLSFGYDNDNALVRMTDSAGNIYRFSYDAWMNLSTVTYPGSVSKTYVYNESANTQGASLIASMTGVFDENGTRYSTYKYFSNGQAMSSEHAGGVYKFSFTYNTGSTSFIDPLGTTYTAPYSIIQGVPGETGRSKTCTGCGGTSTEVVTYDTNRNMSSKKDFNGNLSCFTYDTTRDLETARTEGLSGSGTCASPVTTSTTRTITTEWNSTLRTPRRTAGPLKITTYAFNGDAGVSCAPSGSSPALVCSKSVQATTDATGGAAFTATPDGATRVWAYTYNASGQVLTIDGPRSDVADVTTFAYYSTNDVSGNYRIGDLASVTNALAQVTQFTQYDANGRLKKTIDPNGLESILGYDLRGRLTSRQVGTSASGYETTAYEYWPTGLLKKVTQPDLSFVSYTYDNAQRLTTIQDGLGNKITYTLDNMGNRTAEQSYEVSGTLVRAHTRVLDALNRVKQEIGGTTPTTQITQQAYDGNDNLVTITDPLSRVTTQIFDGLNRLVEVRDPFNGTSAPTKYEYNGQGQLTKVTDPANLATTYTVNGHGETLTQASPDTGATTFTFDAASNMKTRLDARGIQANYSYDALNRLSQIVYPDETVTYTWDTCTNGVGRLCSVVDNSGTTTFAFDIKGRVISKSQTVGTLTKTMGYSYNSAGQLSTVTTPSGKSVVYTYSNNRPVSVTVDGTKVLDTVFYEPFGPSGGWHWGNSTPTVPNTHTRLFDKDFRSTRITSDLPVSGTQPYFDRQVTWDIQSRVAATTDLANSALNASFGYDALDRITSATQGSASWGYSYSGVGDRLTSTVNSSTTSYTYPSTSHRLQSLSGAQTKSYSYDSVGNQTSDGTLTWTYAGNNRPTQAGTTTFLINALGQRLKETSASGATHFVYDESGHLWGEYDATGALIAETIWLDDMPVGTFKNALNYVHPDQLGTPRMITRGSDNAIVWRWDNAEVFGNSAPDENPSGLGAFSYNLRFPGQYFDAETGTHYNYFRDYDPSIGRYVESDPLGLAAGLSTFGYAWGRPLGVIDPRGLDPNQMCVAACTMAGVMAGGMIGEALGGIAGGAVGVGLGTAGGPPGMAVGGAWGASLGGAAGGAAGAAAGGAAGDAAGQAACPDKPECHRATKFELLEKGITDPEQYKKDHGAVPVSRFDICKCKDGSIRIARMGMCGKTTDFWE